MLGLDEAGVGPGFGNLVASAVHILETTDDLNGLTDSKLLSEKKRDMFYETITQTCYFGIGVVTNEEIDQFSLGEARRRVFERALDDFVRKYPSFKVCNLIVDGTIFRPWKDVPYQCLPRADKTIPAVSAASIVAKVTRDRQVIALCDEFPDLHDKYKIRNNKGYLSAEHKQGIATHGLSSYHRHSYKIKLSNS